MFKRSPRFLSLSRALSLFFVDQVVALLDVGEELNVASPGPVLSMDSVLSVSSHDSSDTINRVTLCVDVVRTLTMLMHGNPASKYHFREFVGAFEVSPVACAFCVCF